MISGTPAAGGLTSAAGGVRRRAAGLGHFHRGELLRGGRVNAHGGLEVPVSAALLDGHRVALRKKQTAKQTFITSRRRQQFVIQSKQ